MYIINFIKSVIKINFQHYNEILMLIFLLINNGNIYPKNVNFKMM
jgi:hypothetical protein